MKKSENQKMEFETLLQHFAEEEKVHHAVVQPLFQNSLFVYKTAEEFVDRLKDRNRWDYSRVANPTIDIAERKIAQLEKTDRARLFSSGMGAITAVIMFLTKSGDHVICTDSAYGPTKIFLQDILSAYNVETSFVDGRDVNAIEQAIKPNTVMIYMESPGSMYFYIQDIASIVSLAKSRDITTVFDNSNATPFYQNPTEFGVDFVIHTVTKYLGGHSDIVAGVACGRDEQISLMEAEIAVTMGANADPFAAWLLNRSLRTLAIRMERHSQSAFVVAKYLESHPKVAKVFYPWLASHEGHELAKKQMRGASGLLSFVLKDDSKQNTFQVINNLRIFQIGVSWGGYESLAIPFATSGVINPFASESTEERWAIRCSIGLENVNDLLNALDDALKQAK